LPAGHVPGLPGHQIHVGHVCADVAGGVVTAAQRLDEPPVRAQQRLGLDLLRVAPDDRLAAAEVEPRERVLVRHAAGQLEHVVQGSLFVDVRVEPGATERGAESGRVDPDDRLQAGLLVLTEDDLLVSDRFLVIAGEYAHVCS
jgi:hypothetical protein